MRISDAELRAKVLTGSLRGVALDTSVFIKSRFLFHAGLLRQLERFKESGIACLITDVVRREMLKHHEDEVDKAELALKKASAACDDLQMLPLDLQRRMKERSSLNACDHSKSRIDSYLSEIGAVVLGVAEWVQLEAVNEAYFSKKPPFQDGKKSEFPDAFSLMSLESWASGNDGEVLIISQDQGWEKFAEQSSVLHCGPSIAEALSALYESQPLLINEIILLIQGDAFEGVEAGLGVAIESLIVSADANSFGHTDVDILDLSLRSLLVDSLHPSDLVVIERTVDHVTVQCRLVAALDISAMVDIGVYDSVDKDYVFLDGGEIFRTDKVDLTVLMKFGLCTGEATPQPVFEGLELAQRHLHIDLGYVEFDHGPEEE